MNTQSNGHKSILLVDDHTLFREGLKVLLKQNPVFVVVGEAGTVREASEKALELKPDLILMDIALPDGAGIDAAKTIRKDLPSAKVVMISMYSKMDFIIKALQAGAVGFIVKDSTPDMLVKALTTVTQGHYYFDHTVLDEMVQFILEKQEDTPNISDTKYDKLTPREQEIMRLVAQGLSTKEIASKLCISKKTVENHRTKIMEKIELDSVIDLVKYAAKLGIIELQPEGE